MNTIKKNIVTDTNIITDLNNAGLLEDYASSGIACVCDLVKVSKFNENTCSQEISDKIKTIEVTSEEIKIVVGLRKIEKKLSKSDLVNYVVAKERNYMLATGDNRLKEYSEADGVSVIRTLGIIKLMVSEGIITKEKAINGCKLLMANPKTRIPTKDIEDTIILLGGVVVGV